MSRLAEVKRPLDPKKFFSEEEKQRIVAAIQAAEKETSGEIRVHLDRACDGDVFQRALKVFHKIGMTQTAQRNGVLIYLALKNRRFAIVGDEGIDRVVPENFWQDVADILSAHFKEGKFCEGLCAAIARIGEKLKEFFPYRKDDVNELSDEISTE
ncbi:MAG: TPM domain-containing protein [Calditrichaeota bacterium]|nr:MAG: TPM domain-containing protein [Calditrichota bacterium]